MPGQTARCLPATRCTVPREIPGGRNFRQPAEQRRGIGRAEIGVTGGNCGEVIVERVVHANLSTDGDAR